MKIVEYSDSEPEDEVASRRTDALPSLPANFLDLYSSTVRTSTKDDPALHAGRVRVTPHIEGNWPTHVYLEWFPLQQQTKILERIIEEASGSEPSFGTQALHSLLHNDLGVALPLHVSLSRPLVLRTDQKEHFHAQLEDQIKGSRITTILVKPQTIQWHPNEDGSRHFLVLRLEQHDDKLTELLAICNNVAEDFGLPLLYSARSGVPTPASSTSESLQATPNADTRDRFHISIGWSLQPHLENAAREHAAHELDCLRDIEICFSTVKVRIGQAVSSISLAR